MSDLALLQPFEMGDLSLKNRVVLAPLTRSRAGQERLANALMAEYYTQRSNAGLLITEATVISHQAIGWLESPGIYTEAQTQSWQQVTEAVHAQDTPIFMQLWHTGRASHSSFQPNHQLPVAPSALAINGDEIHTPIGKQPYETPRALETDEIPGIVEDYRHAAHNALQAGFDGVEIHAANGYLIDQFLQSKTNQRSDRYGGNVENRYRFLKEIVEAILTVFPAHRIGVRLSPNGGFNDMGSPDYRETFHYVAEKLNTYDLGYLHIMDGLEFGFHELGQAMTLDEFRSVFDSPLMGNCGYNKDTAETAIQSGQVDLIAFGRPYISNPDLVERFARDWPLNPYDDMTYWYSGGAKGYTDYPTYNAIHNS